MPPHKEEHHSLARNLIKARIERLVAPYDFSIRSKTHPDECPCYKTGKTCHPDNREELNCFFCFCPDYDLSKQEGGCLKGNPESTGRFYKNLNIQNPNKRIWDCTHCHYPHKKENITECLEMLFKIS